MMPSFFASLDIGMLQRNSLALVIGIVVVLSVNFILKRVFRRFSKQNTKTTHFCKLYLILNATGRPLRLYLWLLLLFYGVYFVAIKVFDLSYDAWYGKFVTISTFAILLWIAFRLIRGIEYFYIAKLPKGKKSCSFEVSGIKALSRLSQLGGLLVFILIVLGVLEIPVSGLITVGGVGGIAIAYAGKDILSNFLGGVMIYVNRQFAIGDSVRSPDRDIEGVVEQMGWRYTTIRRPDKQVMYVPNSLFSDILLINVSRIAYRGIIQTFGVRYQDISKIPAIFKDIRAFLEQNSDIDQALGVQINISAFAASSVNFNILAYTDVTDKHPFNQVQDEILLKVAAIVVGHGADFAYPTMTLDLPESFKK